MKKKELLNKYTYYIYENTRFLIIRKLAKEGIINIVENSAQPHSIKPIEKELLNKYSCTENHLNNLKKNSIKTAKKKLLNFSFPKAAYKIISNF